MLVAMKASPPADATSSSLRDLQVIKDGKFTTLGGSSEENPVFR